MNAKHYLGNPKQFPVNTEPVNEAGRLPQQHCTSWPSLYSHQIHRSNVWRAWCTACGDGVSSDTELGLKRAVARWLRLARV